MLFKQINNSAGATIAGVDYDFKRFQVGYVHIPKHMGTYADSMFK